ncbi:hypothetical protein EZV62_019392 [Acer yangbiense]|uniref:Leucine-rich repeat-containing N-terminal plant-type domain-containing protein n=1 Tax=Acer yangbiense TaxID=1000413 RepID=A0A5C7HD55_9ROSI|nr:hypothetical protein EZV62_019392 [Acer yangbiense]
MQPLCHDDERSTLFQFKESISIEKYVFYNPFCCPKVESWKLEGGNSSSANCCSWDGVKCDEETGHVIKLDLSSSCLYGSINSTTTLFHLVHLQWLILAYNHFNHSEIPATINNLSRLSHLNLSYSAISGQIPPQLIDLPNLVSLDLSDNNFIDIPGNETRYLELREPSLQNLIDKLTNLEVVNYKVNFLPNLSILKLSGNINLTGYLPEFEKSSPITVLAIGSCGFSGTIPSSLANLTKLVSLDGYNFSGQISYSILDQSIGLRSCNLSNFPNFLRNQDFLRVLDLSSNNITGKILVWFLNVRTDSLLYLNLSHNLFTGFEQHPIVLPQYLFTFDLRFNKLQGPLPVQSWFMSKYLVSNNKLTGEISPLIYKSKHLYALDLSNNNLSGVLPQCLANFNDALSILALQSNEFHGSIPQTFMNGNNLKMIDLSNNHLQGRIPRSLVNCTNLEYLHLGNNQITDIFPSWLGTLRELKVLILKSNRLYGEIKEPEKNFEFPKLQVIDLSHNMFRGELPSKHFQSWNAMKVVNGSHLSYMHDEIQPTRFYVQVVSYDISNYAYLMTISNKGHIPSSLGNLTALESLDLSNNRLSGEIPQQLVEITFLEVFNVSYNHPTGLIPQGKQFDTFENSSYHGNLGLCGKPLSKQCETSKPSKKEDEDSESLIFVFDWKTVLIGFASGLIVGVVLGQEFYIRNHEWLVKFFRVKNMKRKRGRKN